MKSPALPVVSLLTTLVRSSFPDCKQFSADLALYSNFLLLETFPWDLAQGVAREILFPSSNMQAKHQCSLFPHLVSIEKGFVMICFPVLIPS